MGEVTNPHMQKLVALGKAGNLGIKCDRVWVLQAGSRSSE